MPTPVTRYIKRHYKMVAIHREDWEKLREIANRENIPVTTVIKLLIMLYYHSRGEVGERGEPAQPRAC